MAIAVALHPPPLSPTATGATSSELSDHNSRRLLQLLSQCADMSELKQIHAQTLRTTCPRDCRTLFLHSRILHFSSAADLNYAHRVFHQVDTPNSFMWNTLIRALATRNDRKEDAIATFRRMMVEGTVSPDKHTFPFVLKACSYLFALAEGKQVQAQVLKHGLGSDVYITNSLIHLYSSCGDLKIARKLFDKMPDRSVVSFNTMIDALVRFGEFSDSLKLFREMQRLFYKPDGYTIQSILSACASLGSSSLGMWAHSYTLRNSDIIEANDVLINAALVDMYCKCGLLELADQVFERMDSRDVNSWNSMILGFAMHGQANRALEYFANMITDEKLNPNSVTFVGVLSACNHRGMVDDGKKYLDMMIHEFNIEPQLEHYGCLVDLLARAGLINEALDLVSGMPLKPDAVIWRSLLNACCKKNAGPELSEAVAMKVLESGGECSGVYVLLSRIYASARQWNDVAMVRTLMTERGVPKDPGCSLTEINGVSHEFFAGDTSHPQSKEIYMFLRLMEEKLILAGYEADVSQAPLVDDELSGGSEREDSLRLHSERLAIAFGLLNRKSGTPIRIFKNLRVCNDCHKVTKLVSRIFDVEIVVRDRARFHHFKDGVCSCRDYW